MIMMGDRKRAVAAILGTKDGEKEAPKAIDSLQSMAEELLDCIKSNDASGVTSALKAIFMELDSEPYDEYGESERE